MSVLISVIIPVYNAEEYIEECIKSLLNQTLKNIEFIFINDGSKDNSQYIIEKYKKVDSRIILINQKNQGVSIARNQGINRAKGKYIGFVDADDYVEADMYEKLYNSAIVDKCDLVLSNWENEVEGKKIIMKYKFPIDVLLGREFIKKYIITYFLHSEDLNAVWNKIYKTQIIKINNIQFPKEITLGEDSIFNMTFFSISNSMKYIDYVGYHYREVNGSATRNILNKDYFKRALDVYNTDVEEICNISIDKEEIKRLKSLKLIDNVKSYIYIYMSSTDLRLKNKFRYVKHMIRNKQVQEAIDIYENYNNLEKYEKFIIKMIRKKSILGLYVATTYSRLRNT